MVELHAITNLTAVQTIYDAIKTTPTLEALRQLAAPLLHAEP